MDKTKYQKFEMETIWRSEIKLHPKNPRVITESAKKKLKSKMADIGLLQPLIINKTTGYLLGGHQRLATLDSLEKYKEGKNDYQLDVSMVELDEQKELEMLVFLNNPSAQGQWDSSILADIGGDISFEDMGFDRVDIEILFDGDARFDSIFEDNAAVSETKDILDDIKADRKKMKENKSKEQSIDYYVTVVCQNSDEKEQLMKHLGLPKGEIYISPHEILSLKRSDSN